MSNNISPYLSQTERLADVISAIQAMGTYKFYKLTFEGWSKKISGSENNSAHWSKVIKEHPEFFRMDNTKTKASLVWRRNYQRTYHVDKNKVLTREECNALPGKERSERVSRLPLSSSDISVLVSTAINLHSRALEKEKASRWWVTPAVGILGIVIGALVKAYV
ncbi:hypothetical protein MNBD_GAMMA26-1075, partial [hydrothermal vent metagenome]